MHATAGGEFSSRSLSECLKQALGLFSDLRQWCTVPCHGASLPVFWHCQLSYHSMFSASSAREFEQSLLLYLHLAHAWQQTLLEEIPWRRMLGQSLDPLCPTILTSSWPPLVPLSLQRKEAPTQKLPVVLFREMLTFVISVTEQVMLLLSNSKIQEQSRMEVIRAYL